MTELMKRKNGKNKGTLVDDCLNEKKQFFRVVFVLCGYVDLVGCDKWSTSGTLCCATSI